MKITQEEAKVVCDALMVLLKGIPIHGVQLGDVTQDLDFAKFKVDYKDEATAEQRAQGDSIIAGFSETEWLRDKRYAEVSAKTGLLIENGFFTFKGVAFQTDAINQANFQTLTIGILAGQLTYPYTIWNGNAITTLDSAEEASSFTKGFFEYIANVRYTGKVLRDTLQSMSLEELTNFKDER